MIQLHHPTQVNEFIDKLNFKNYIEIFEMVL